jgi:hypothetical protein
MRSGRFTRKSRSSRRSTRRRNFKRGGNVGTLIRLRVTPDPLPKARGVTGHMIPFEVLIAPNKQVIELKQELFIGHGLDIIDMKDLIDRAKSLNNTGYLNRMGGTPAKFFPYLDFSKVQLSVAGTRGVLRDEARLTEYNLKDGDELIISRKY